MRGNMTKIYMDGRFGNFTTSPGEVHCATCPPGVDPEEFCKEVRAAYLNLVLMGKTLNERLGYFWGYHYGRDGEFRFNFETHGLAITTQVSTLTPTTLQAGIDESVRKLLAVDPATLLDPATRPRGVVLDTVQGFGSSHTVIHAYPYWSVRKVYTGTPDRAVAALEELQASAKLTCGPAYSPGYTRINLWDAHYSCKENELEGIDMDELERLAHRKGLLRAITELMRR